MIFQFFLIWEHRKNIHISNKGISTAIAKGLIGWEGLEGAPPFNKENVAALPFEVYMEIAGKIIELSAMQEDEVKN